MNKRINLLSVLLLTFAHGTFAAEAAKLGLVEDVELQPLAAQVRRLVEALDYLGAPLTEAEKARLREASDQTEPAKGVALIQEALDPHCLAAVTINPEM